MLPVWKQRIIRGRRELDAVVSDRHSPPGLRVKGQEEIAAESEHER